MINMAKGSRGLIGALALASLLVGCAGPGSAPAEPEAAPPVAARVPAKAGPERTAPQPPSDTDLTRPEWAVFFDPGSSTIDGEGMAVLRQGADRLRADRRLRVVLLGMTDDQGSVAYNVAIADRRIAAVQSVLRDLGVQAGQIRRRNVAGEPMPQSCSTSACRKTMRRVELRFSQEAGK